MSTKRKKVIKPAYKFLMGATEWKVLVQPDPPNGEDTKDHHYHGYCDPVNRLIWVNSADDPSVRVGTFLHELMHACEYMTGAHVGHKYIEGGANFMHQALLPLLDDLLNVLSGPK